MKVFSREKYIKEEGGMKYSDNQAWVDMCDGEQVENYQCEGYRVYAKWCKEVPEGCEYCRNESPFESMLVEDCDENWDGDLYNTTTYEDRYIGVTDFQYCPYCGKPLTKKDKWEY